MLPQSLARATFVAAFRADEERFTGPMVKITKLLPGKAIGADDLLIWARRRNGKLSGVPDDERQRKKRFRQQKRGREKWLRKHRRKHPRKGLVDIALEELLKSCCAGVRFWGAKRALERVAIEMSKMTQR